MASPPIGPIASGGMSQRPMEFCCANMFRLYDSTAPSRARLESMQLEPRYAANLISREEFNTAMESFMVESRKYMKEVDKHRCDGKKVYGGAEEYRSPPMNADQFYQQPSMPYSAEMGLGSTGMLSISDRYLSRSDMSPMSPIASYGMDMSPSPAMNRNSKRKNREGTGMIDRFRRGTRSGSPLGSPPRLAGGRMRTTMRGNNPRTSLREDGGRLGKRVTFDD